MATILQTPVLNPITPFDPTKEYTITFTYDDNQAVKSRARIILNTTGDVVYDETQNITSGLQHRIPANTLVVGNQYTVQVQVFDIDNNNSNLSDPVLFYCFTQPTFSLDVVNGTIIEATSLELTLSYTQTEDEPLKSVQFMKYSYDGTQLSSSSVLYTSASTTSYTFYSLDNETSYYFRAVGETSHGISLDTGYIEVTVQFEDNPLVVAFDVENIYKQGYISIATNIKDVEYELSNDNYRFENGMLILENNWLEYSNGVNIPNDFSLYVDAYSVKAGTFLTSNDNTFSLSTEEICGTYYGVLSVGDFKQYVALSNAYLTDNKIVRLSSDENTVTFEVKRINGYYNLSVYDKATTQ